MNIKCNKGITPTTIVLTIMLMLIISQITIVTVIKENIALIELIKVNENQINSSENEKVISAVTEATTRSTGILEKEMLDEAMDNKFGEEWEYFVDDIQEDCFGIKIKDTGNKYTILKDGTIRKKINEEIKEENDILLNDGETVLIGE